MIDPVRQEIITTAHTIVVKVGTGVVTRPDATLDADQITSLVDQVHRILETGRKVVIVSSGAIGAGLGQLGLKKRPGDLPHLQAAASIGQSFLMQAYDHALRRHGYHAAQILLTAADFEDRSRYLNVRHTILTLFEYRAVPIINENDTVSVDEIRFGDNDRLAALVTNLLRAPLLVILSVVEGLFTSDPARLGRAEPRTSGAAGSRVSSRVRVSERSSTRVQANPADGTAATPLPITTVERLDDEIFRLAGVGTSDWGTGGMRTKLEAARLCTQAGESVLIAGGRRPGVLEDVLAGRPVGTLFLARGSALRARQRWIGLTVRPRGRYVVDAGARRAIERAGKSLLAIGVVDVTGQFQPGDPVAVCDASGTEFARGLTNYSSDDARRIMGQRTAQIRTLLGALPYDEIIHRDNLVITDTAEK